jgi:hypothetical protein
MYTMRKATGVRRLAAAFTGGSKLPQRQSETKVLHSTNSQKVEVSFVKTKMGRITNGSGRRKKMRPDFSGRTETCMFRCLVELPVRDRCRRW